MSIMRRILLPDVLQLLQNQSKAKDFTSIPKSGPNEGSSIVPSIYIADGKLVVESTSTCSGYISVFGPELRRLAERLGAMEEQRA